MSRQVKDNKPEAKESAKSSSEVTDMNAVQLRERRQMAGGMSRFERQSALTDAFTNMYERMAIERSSNKGETSGQAQQSTEGGGASGGNANSSSSPNFEINNMTPSTPPQGVNIPEGVNKPTQEQMLGMGLRPEFAHFATSSGHMEPTKLGSGNSFEGAGHHSSSSSFQSVDGAFSPVNIDSSVTQLNQGSLWDLHRESSPFLKAISEFVFNNTFEFIKGAFNFLFHPGDNVLLLIFELVILAVIIWASANYIF